MKPFHLFREEEGLISPKPVWVFYWGPYMYVNRTLLGLAWEFITEFQSDKHLLG